MECCRLRPKQRHGPTDPMNHLFVRFWTSCPLCISISKYTDTFVSHSFAAVANPCPDNYLAKEYIMCIVQRVKLSLPLCHDWDTTSSQSPAVHRPDSPYSHPGERKEYVDSQQRAETPPVPMSESDQPPRFPEPGDLPAQECNPRRSGPGKESGHEMTREPSIRGDSPR
jgi:hypothetical protein